MSQVDKLRQLVREIIEESVPNRPFAVVDMSGKGDAIVKKTCKTLDAARQAAKGGLRILRLKVDVKPGQGIDRYRAEQMVLESEELEEMNTTSNVGGYNVPGAFSDDELDKGTDRKGRNGGRVKTKEGGARARNAEVLGYTLVENSNRWLDLKKDDTRSSVQKIGYGLREIKKQLKEVEDFTRWYKRLRLENDVDTNRYWKRTSRDLDRIKGRIVNIAKNIQEIAP